MLRSYLARLLVLGLVPVLVIAFPGRASAEVVWMGDVAQAQVRYQAGFGGKFGTPGYWIDCNVSGYNRTHDTGSNSVRATLRCRTGWAFPGADAVQLTAYGEGGEGCEFTAYTPITIDANSDTTLTRTLSTTEPVDPSCVLTTGRLDVYDVGRFGESDPVLTADKIFGWALGSFEALADTGPSDDATGTCPLFTITKKPRIISYGIGSYPDTSSAGQPALTATVRFPSIIWGSPAVYPAQTLRVIAYWKSATGVYRASPTGSIGGSAVNSSASSRLTYPALTKADFVLWETPAASAAGGTLGPTAQLVGVQVIALRDAANTEYPAGNGFSSTPAIPTNSSAEGGLTVPGNCWFYWGEKIADTTATTTDEPAGPINLGDPTTPAEPVTEPTELPNDSPVGNTEEGCDGFSFTDPSSWAGAGICILVKAVYAMVSLLETIANGILALPGAIVGAIGDLLGALVDAIGALFLPSDGFLEGELDEVQSAFSQSTVGNYSSAFTDLDVPVASAGCAGPQLDFTIKGKAISWEPLNACSGGVATLAGLSKMFLTVVLSFFGGMACLRAVGSGFGWRPGVAEAAA